MFEIARKLVIKSVREAYAGEAGGTGCLSALIHGGQEGQELPFILNSFHLSYLLKGHFLAFCII